MVNLNNTIDLEFGIKFFSDDYIEMIIEIILFFLRKFSLDLGYPLLFLNIFFCSVIQIYCLTFTP